MPDWFNADIAMRGAAVFGAVVIGCSGILASVSKLTKNTWDDDIAAWWLKYPMKLVGAFSIFNPKK